MQEKKQLEDKLLDLRALEKVLFEEIDDISKRIKPVNDKLDDAVKEKDTAYKRHLDQLEGERRKVLYKCFINKIIFSSIKIKINNSCIFVVFFLICSTYLIKFVHLFH